MLHFKIKLLIIILIVTIIPHVRMVFPQDDIPFEFDWAKEKELFIESYSYKEKLDTVINILLDGKNERLTIIYERYCLFDSAIVLPKGYVWSDIDSTFITHNFAIKLSLRSDNIKLDTIIEKKDLINIIESIDLYKYGTFLDFYIDKNMLKKWILKFNFSYSIPLTDIGCLVSVTYKKGKLIFKIE